MANKTIAEVKTAYDDAAHTKVSMSMAVPIIFAAIIIGFMLAIGLRALFRFNRLRPTDHGKHIVFVALLIFIFLVLALGFIALVTG